MYPQVFAYVVVVLIQENLTITSVVCVGMILVLLPTDLKVCALYS